MRRRDLCLCVVLLAQAFSASAPVLDVDEPGFNDSQWPLAAPSAPSTIAKPAPFFKIPADISRSRA
jgi:hypothetical protein